MPELPLLGTDSHGLPGKRFTCYWGRINNKGPGSCNTDCMDTYKLETESGWVNVTDEYRDGERVVQIRINEQINREYRGTDGVKKGDKEWKIALSLQRRFGDLEVCEDQNFIPVKVAREGKAPISAYLFAVHGLDPEEIADRLQVKRNTILQYINKFKHDYR